MFRIPLITTCYSTFWPQALLEKRWSSTLRYHSVLQRCFELDRLHKFLSTLLFKRIDSEMYAALWLRCSTHWLSMHPRWIVFSLRPKLSHPYRSKSVQCICAYRRYSFCTTSLFLRTSISLSGCYLLRELSSSCCYFHPGTECALNGITISSKNAVQYRGSTLSIECAWTLSLHLFFKTRFPYQRLFYYLQVSQAS